MGHTLTKMTIVKARPADVFLKWKEVERFPQFMENVKSVRRVQDRLTDWIVKGPFGMDVNWRAVTTRLEPNQRIAWKANGNAVKTSGQVTFTELPAGETQITLTMQFAPRGGTAGSIAARLLGRVERKMEADLWNFKRYAEESNESQPSTGPGVM